LVLFPMLLAAPLPQLKVETGLMDLKGKIEMFT
jgi:hypothetical protein